MKIKFWRSNFRTLGASLVKSHMSLLFQRCLSRVQCNTNCAVAVVGVFKYTQCFHRVSTSNRSLCVCVTTVRSTSHNDRFGLLIIDYCTEIIQ